MSILRISIGIFSIIFIISATIVIIIYSQPAPISHGFDKAWTEGMGRLFFIFVFFWVGIISGILDLVLIVTYKILKRRQRNI